MPPCHANRTLLFTPTFSHPTLHALHSKLHTQRVTLHNFSPHFTLSTLHSTLPAFHFKLHASHSTLHTAHTPLHIPHSALHTSHFTLSTPRSTLHTPHFTLSTLHALHTPPSTLHILHAWHSPLRTPRFTLQNLHSTLQNLHSITSQCHALLHVLKTRQRSRLESCESLLASVPRSPRPATQSFISHLKTMHFLAYLMGTATARILDLRKTSCLSATKPHENKNPSLLIRE